jgi:hypothetical protein
MLGRMRDEMVRRLVAAAKAEPRIAGLLDYGSELGVDAWSDLDVEVYIADESFDELRAEWMDWAGRLGEVLLRFWFSLPGEHPWLVYAAEPVPLRVDFSLHRASEIERIAGRPNCPASLDVVLHDPTGRLRRAVEPLVGRDLPPPDLRRFFDDACGGLWSYLLRTDARLRRRDTWEAMQGHAWLVLGCLFPLLKLEADPPRERKWLGTPRQLERAIGASRLAELEACWPASEADLRRALSCAARLGASVCAAIATREGWPWPEELAGRVERLLTAG